MVQVGPPGMIPINERLKMPLSPPSFRDGPKDQTRNLEIPGSMLCIAPE
jgi:hypothetical protein